MSNRLRSLFRRLRGSVRNTAGRTNRAARSRPERVLLFFGGLALVLAVTLGFFGSQTAPSTIPQTPSSATVTYVGTWDLIDLTRHLEAGDVLTISRFTQTKQAPAAIYGGHTVAGSAVPTTVLAAETRDGQWVQLDLSQTPDEAVSALRALGYGHLLSAEALSALPTPTPAATTSDSSPFSGFLFMAAIFLFLGAFVMFMARRGSSGPMSAASGAGGRPGSHGHFTVIAPDKPGDKVDQSVAERLARLPLLSDIAGVDEAKFELTEVIDFLKDPTPFAAMGARIPRGVMLYGPPGTGKTSLAKAVAREANVTFIHTSGADFVEMYVGMGAKRVREVFAEARKAGRAVVFVDEFDALGKSRGGPSSHDEREQTLNALLKELDGFDTTDTVVVVGATNRLDTLDPALLRPGRFGRQVNVPNPDRKGREEILAVHAVGKPLGEDVNLQAVARQTFGFSGAMLADILNEAAILAVRRKSATINAPDVAAGWLKVAMGVSRTRSMADRERSIIAVHEAGHAVCGRLHGELRRVEKISLRAHGDALGYTASSSEDNALPAESDLRAQLIAFFGGRAAEVLLFHDKTGGGRDDFGKAHDLAELMVQQLGMGRDPADDGPVGPSGRGALSFLVYREGRVLPASVQEAQTRAVAAILDESYTTALATLSAEQDRLERVAAYLYEAEEIDGDEFDALMEGRLSPQSPSAWRTDAAHPRSPEEIADTLAHTRIPVGVRPPVQVPQTPAPSTPATVRPKPSPFIPPTPSRRRRRPSFPSSLGDALRRRVLAWLRVGDEPGIDVS